MSNQLSAINSQVQTATDNPAPKAGKIGTEIGSGVSNTQQAAELSETAGFNPDSVVQKLNEFMDRTSRSVSFSVDKSSDKLVVTVVDNETEEVIRQIPNEDAIKLSAYIESVVGLIFNKKV